MNSVRSIKDFTLLLNCIFLPSTLINSSVILIIFISIPISMIYEIHIIIKNSEYHYLWMYFWNFSITGNFYNFLSAYRYKFISLEFFCRLAEKNNFFSFKVVKYYFAYTYNNYYIHLFRLTPTYQERRKKIVYIINVRRLRSTNERNYFL